MKKTDYKLVTIANGRSDITLHEPIYKGLKKKGQPTPPEPEPEPDPLPDAEPAPESEPQES